MVSRFTFVVLCVVRTFSVRTEDDQEVSEESRTHNYCKVFLVSQVGVRKYPVKVCRVLFGTFYTLHPLT